MNMSGERTRALRGPMELDGANMKAFMGLRPGRGPRTQDQARDPGPGQDHRTQAVEGDPRTEVVCCPASRPGHVTRSGWCLGPCQGGGGVFFSILPRSVLNMR